MSVKVTAFRTLYTAPQTLDKFVVYIPTLVTSPLSVTAASFPFETYKESSFPVNGYSMSFPTRKVIPGDWSCVMEESVLNLNGLNIKVFQEYVMYPYGNASTSVVSSVAEALSSESGESVSSTNVLSVLANGFVPKDRTASPQPILFDIYVALLDSATGLIPVRVACLKWCYLKAVGSFEMGASKATDPLKYHLTFRYQMIKQYL